MKLIHKDVHELNRVEYRACYKANYGTGGYMQGDLNRAKLHRDGKVILLWDGTADSVSSLLAWSLLIPTKTAPLTKYAKSNSKFIAQFWVKRPHRKKGYGSLLMKEVLKYDPKPYVYPHDKSSASLFADYEVTTSIHDRRLLQVAKRNKIKA